MRCGHHPWTLCGGAWKTLLKVGQVKEIYENDGKGHSIRGIARELEVSRNTVRKYLKLPQALAPKARKPRASKMDPYTKPAVALPGGLAGVAARRSLGLLHL